MQDCSNNIENIAEKPDDDKGEGKAIGGRAAKIFYDLRGVDDDPAGYGYRTEKRQNLKGLSGGGRKETLPGDAAQGFKIQVEA